MNNDKFEVMNVRLLMLFLALLLASCSPSPQQGLGVYPKAVGAADEGFAIQALRTIATAQTQFKVTRGSYGDFDSLTQAGLLDQRFASATPTLKGYRLSMKSSENEFTVNADPETQPQGTTGSRHFYLESSDTAIHVNATQTAGKTDPIL
jgi:hypothetical protein